MPRSHDLTEFELLVMLAVMRLGDSGYSVSIREEIGRRTGRKVSRGSVFTTLRRLLDKDLVETWKGAPTAARGGRAKRHYRPTARGRRSVAAAREALDAMFQGVDTAAHGL